MIGDTIEIKVLAIEGDQVKLGVVAPKHIDVHRKEVYRLIQEENKQALHVSQHLFDQLKKQ